MADIFHDFPIAVPARLVFPLVSTPQGLDCWWTKRASGQPGEGEEFELWFGPQYDWRAKVTRHSPDLAFELQLVRADPDWLGTRVGFELEDRGETTAVRFHHIGWPTANEHWRTSCYCWAMYLRILRRYLALGESVPYEKRLDA
jgi:uncharacterized protein YndB with AHSA1/START domain